MSEKIVLEVCVDSLESAINAQNGGANRIELCSNLNIGGTTPTQGLLELIKEYISIEVYAMIRPRGGDFYYTDLEYEVIKKEIENVKKLGVDGIVIGMLLPNGEIDIKRMEEVISLARPLKITFHRAFDKSNNLLKSLECLISLGVDRVLTSGGENYAIDGIDTIKKLVDKSQDKIIIMPGSGINYHNVKDIINFTNVSEVHMSARRLVMSNMQYRNEKINNNGNLIISEHHNFISDYDVIKSIVNLINEEKKL